MRNKTFIAAMVGVAAAVAVAGSVNAAIVDPFTQFSDETSTATATVYIAHSGSWLGGVFNTRTSVVNRGSGGTTPSGGLASSTRSETGLLTPSNSWVGTFKGDNANSSLPASVGLSYTNANSSAVAIDFDKIMIDVAFAGTTRNAGSYVSFYFADVTGLNFMEAKLTLTGAQLSASSLTIEFGKSQFALSAGSGPFNWNQVTDLGVIMSAAGARGAGQTWTGTNFQMTAVPAPGALALLGVAGVVGARRRRV
jgi:MYXO-CTERM domain-containing protein